MYRGLTKLEWITAFLTGNVIAVLCWPDTGFVGFDSCFAAIEAVGIAVGLVFLIFYIKNDGGISW